jgi:sugar lactone lactonase YvrE
MRRPSRFGHRVVYYRSLLLSRVSGEGFCVFITGFVLTLGMSLPSAFGLETAADLVLGQVDFTRNGTNGGFGSTNRIGLNVPFAVVLDRSVVPNRVYVSDYNNNRVLGWGNISALRNGAPADLVIGQPNFSTGSCNTGGINAGTLCVPMGLAVDGAGNLYVADRGNSRILVYFTPFSSDGIADRVLGQTNFTSGGCSNPSSSSAAAGSLCAPVGVAVDSSGNVYAADMGNNRALEYDVPLGTDLIADRVFGQSNFTGRAAGPGPVGLNQPYAVEVDETGNVFVADFGNNRVLEYDTPLSSDTVADRVIGQANFATTSANTGGVSAGSLRNPSGVSVDGMGNLYVADRSNNRVLKYVTPLTTDTIADKVFGQPNFATVSCNKGGPSANSLCLPTGVDIKESQDLWAADYANNRVLKYEFSTGGIAPGALNQARSGHAATVQPDGTVLVSGGRNASGFLSSTERYNPQTLVFDGLAARLLTPRADQSATPLADGSVLAVGGWNAGGVLNTAELFSPVTDQFSNLSGVTQIARSGQTATALLDGRVMIVGGQYDGALDSSEQFDAQSVVLLKPAFDPMAGVFVTLPHALSTPRWDHTATLLPDGRVLITGGRNDSGYLSSAELFDPATESFTMLPAVQTTPRAGHTATLMPNGRVLILGGQNETGYIATAETFDPFSGTFSPASTGLTAPRANHTATILYTGEVLITGGENANGVLSTTELYGNPSTDSIPPGVAQVGPPDQAVGTDLTEIIGVRFSEPVDVRTLNASEISLVGSAIVDAIVAPGEEGLMVFIVPKAGLFPGTTYTLTLSPGVKDTAGNPLAPFTSRFTTVGAPVITGVAPNHGAAGLAVTITGRNFDPSAPTRNEVKINGVEAIVTSATATQLQTSVPLSAPVGARTLSVQTSGGMDTTAFTVENPIPTLGLMTPDSGVAGSGVFTLTLGGDNFTPASSVTFGSTVLATTFINSMQLSASIPASLLTTPGQFTVTVVNPSPGGGISAGLVFYLQGNGLRIDAISPNQLSQGSVHRIVTITGSEIQPGASVQVSGTGVMVNGTSGTTINQYTVTDSLTGGPVFSWLDATNGTLVLPPCDLCDSGYIPIGFPLTVFNQPIASFSIESKGFVRFHSDFSDFIVSPFADDLISGSVYVQTFGIPPNRVMAIQWNHSVECCDIPDSDLVFELLLHESTNSITFQYLTLRGDYSDGSQAGVDIEDTMSQGTAAYPGTGDPSQPLLTAGLAVTFTPLEPTVPVLTADISVDQTALLGQRDLIVTNPDGGSATLPGGVSIIPYLIQLSITSPSSGSLIDGSSMLVQGTVSAPSGEVGVAVNGVVARVNGNRFAANQVPLVPGENTITAVATDFDGHLSSASVTVTAADHENFVDLLAVPESGTAPLTVNFSILRSMANPVVSFTLDADGDGSVDFTSGTLPDTIPFTYSQPGLYLATAGFTDNQGTRYSDTIAVSVSSLQEVDALLKNKWNGFKYTLVNQDIATSMKYITEGARPKYQGLFERFGDHLPAIAESLPDLQLIRIDGDVAAYYVKKMENGVEKAHFVYFLLDENGLWKLQVF